jgi:glycosyltransferase involved in cell wall biosynthesis
MGATKGLAAVRRLLALSEGPDFVCYRYRLAAFSDALLAAGWQLELVRRPRGMAEFAAALRQIRAADAVIVQRRLLGWAKAALVRRFAGTLIYDFDDAVFARDSNASRGPDDALRWRGFSRMVRAADATLAGSTHLREQANRCGAPERTHRLPTCVDTDRYELAAHECPAGTAELVWVGSRSTMPSLVEARGCLAAAAAGQPGVTLNVICDAFPHLEGIPLRTTEWSAATETRDIAQADIGIAWLPDHPWSLGKCGLKVLQYMAAGLPVVANAVGIHRELVEPGVTGFLANDPQEWRAAVTALAESPALRRRMGAAARARVERDWSVRCWGPRLAAILSATADARSAKRLRGRAA